MNHDDDLDALIETVFHQWIPRRPPADLSTRIAQAVAHDSPNNTTAVTPMSVKPSSPLLLPLLGFVVAAASILVLLLSRAEVVEPTAAVVSQPVGFDRARARLEFCKIAADVKAANTRFPFDAKGSDLSWSRFRELYGPTGRIAVWESGLAMTDAPVSPSAQALFAHARELRITLFGDARGTVPRLRMELQPSVIDPQRRAELFDPSQPARCTLSIGPREHQCGSLYGAAWQAGRDDDVTLTFRDRAGFSTRTVASTGPWALLRFLRRGEEMSLENSSGSRRLRFDVEGADPVQLVYRWMAGVEHEQTQRLLTSQVPVPERLFDDDPPCLAQ